MSKEEPSLSVNVNGQSKVPPGFRFHPTEEELLHYYLRKKVAYEKIDLDVIREIDLNKLEPWDIQEICRIGSTPQNDWYFFSHKDKKYPTGTRTNRATAAGFWKATGRDKVIHSSLRRTGMRKTLVFYKGRAPHGQKSDWIMHEYRLDDNTNTIQDYSYGSNLCESTQEDGWVVCRVFKKKNYHKSVESPQRSSTTAEMQCSKKGKSVHDEFLAYINSRSCKQETESIVNITTPNHDYNHPMQQFMNPVISHKFLHMPRLDSSTSGHFIDQVSCSQSHNSMTNLLKEVEESRDHKHLDTWADVDRLVASQLNGHNEPNEDMCLSFDHDDQEPPQPSYMANTNEANYTSAIDPFYYLSV